MAMADLHMFRHRARICEPAAKVITQAYREKVLLGKNKMLLRLQAAL